MSISLCTLVRACSWVRSTELRHNSSASSVYKIRTKLGGYTIFGGTTKVELPQLSGLEELDFAIVKKPSSAVTHDWLENDNQ